MERQLQAELIQQSGVIAIVRFDRSEELVRVAKAVAAGGVKIIEFTFTTPGALNLIEQTSRELGDTVLLGAGTVLDPETARAAILAGAEFVVAPTLNLKVIETCHRYGKVVIPGAYTPTEMITAWEAGSDFVKVFPADVGGPAYLKAVATPLPQIKLIAVGGVTLENTRGFIKAGAAAVGVGSNLVERRAIAEGRLEQLTENARLFVQQVQEARGA